MVQHYYTESPECEYRGYSIKTRNRGFDLELDSSSGIFSATKVDKGSRLLAESMQIPQQAKVLDLGCGYGVLGIIAALIRPDSKVTLTDINKRAVAVAQKNVKKLGLKNTKVLQGNIYEAVKDTVFNVILLNPPQTAGKELCLKMLSEAPKYLKKGGSVQFVARHNKGGKTLFEYAKKFFNESEILAKNGGYWIYKLVK